MMTTSFSASVQNLRRLYIIRYILAAILSAGLLSGHWFLSLSLSYDVLIIFIVALLSVNLLTHIRLLKPWPVTEPEFFFQLLLDAIGLTVVLYLNGGANNPFVSYFLVPLCISAATLSWAYTWALAVLCLSSYSLLLFFYIPIPDISPAQEHLHHAMQDTVGLNLQSFNLHTFGMWLNFFISALLITYFVVKMAKALRQQEAQLNELKEDDLRDEQLMAVATLAAGTAHELGTPLSTMKVLVKEMQQDYQQPVELQDDLKVLSQQLDVCRQQLQQLRDKAEQNQGSNTEQHNLHQYCHTLLEHWQVMRPEVTCNINIDTQAPEITRALHPTITQSITNLLNNAADANPNDIDINISWSAEQLDIDIDDNGPGIPIEIAEQLGKPFISTKGKGLGLGLFLTHATLNRHGGTVKLYNREQGGTHTELRLPLTSHSSANT